MILPDLDAGPPSVVSNAVALTLGFIAALTLGAAVVMVLFTVDVTVDASGNLEPSLIWPVRAPLSGRVTGIHVGAGDRVQGGTLVVELDASQLLLELARLESQIESLTINIRASEVSAPLERQQVDVSRVQAEVTLMRSRANLLRTLVAHRVPPDVDSFLATYEPGSHVELDLAVADVLSAESTLQEVDLSLRLRSLDEFTVQTKKVEREHARQQLQHVRQQLEGLRIAAPFDGLVLTDVDQLWGAVVIEGETLLEVGDTREWKTNLLVSERDAHKVRVGDRVRLELDVLQPSQSAEISTRVASISPAPAMSNGIMDGPARYRVTAVIDSVAVEALGAASLRAGYTVRAQIVTRSQRLALVVWERLSDRFTS